MLRVDENVIDEELQAAESWGSRHNIWGLVVLGVVACFLLDFLAAWCRFKVNLEGRGRRKVGQEEVLQIQVMQAVQEKEIILF